MKKFVIIGIFFLLLTACEKKSKPPTTTRDTVFLTKDSLPADMNLVIQHLREERKINDSLRELLEKERFEHSKFRWRFRNKILEADTLLNIDSLSDTTKIDSLK